MIDDAPLLRIDFRALEAALEAIFLPDVFLPPVRELTIFVPTELLTDETALVAAF